MGQPFDSHGAISWPGCWAPCHWAEMWASLWHAVNSQQCALKARRSCAWHYHFLRSFLCNLEVSLWSALERGWLRASDYEDMASFHEVPVAAALGLDTTHDLHWVSVMQWLTSLKAVATQLLTICLISGWTWSFVTDEVSHFNHVCTWWFFISSIAGKGMLLLSERGVYSSPEVRCMMLYSIEQIHYTDHEIVNAIRNSNHL